MQRTLIASLIALVLGLLSLSVRADDRETPTVKVARNCKPAVFVVWEVEDTVNKLQGGGFIVDSGGYGLTCEHVVDKLKRIELGFCDRTRLPCKVLWKDAGKDLAFLKVTGVSGQKFTELTLGPVDLEEGEPITAIGHPSGLAWTLTSGVVGKVEDMFCWEPSIDYPKAVQTDAAVNPGNSGGPLFNAHCEAVGMVARKNRFNQGTAWAVNLDCAQQTLARSCSAKAMFGIDHGLVVSEQIIGRVAKPGKSRRAVLVDSIVKDGPAATAGVKVDDWIVKVATKPHSKRPRFSPDGKPSKLAESRTGKETLVTNSFDLERAMYKTRPGDEAVLTIIRDGKEMNVTITLAGDGKGMDTD